jgi:hypothetical protein
VPLLDLSMGIYVWFCFAYLLDEHFARVWVFGDATRFILGGVRHSRCMVGFYLALCLVTFGLGVLWCLDVHRVGCLLQLFQRVIWLD